jgi:uncharacterized protein YndB with AHSA1/START domain
MSDMESNEPVAAELVFECDLEAPPEKVWRALSIVEFRNRWLPADALADAEPISSISGNEIQYGMRDAAPPFLESTVTFQIWPGADGGTHFRIVHRLADVRLEQRAAKNNWPPMMQAA